MQHVDICGETRFYDGPKGLLNLIEEKMGPDTRDALVEFIEDVADILSYEYPASMATEEARLRLRGAL
jgi:hypothetical protein